jgi:hypothetical protein
VVPQKEGKVRAEKTIAETWRGDPYPKQLVLLDNDFYGQPDWKYLVNEICTGGFQVNFNQGINARFLTDETASASASMSCCDSKFKRRCIYTAWDNKKDEKTLMRGLKLLVKHGFKPRQIMVYVLIGYWPGQSEDTWEYRRQKLRDFGVDPYPMPFVRDQKTIGFQRFVVGAYDKRVKWEDFKAARYQPRNLGAVS